jgi:hypothetical protein
VAALVASRAGLDAVDARHAGAGCGHLAGPAAAPGRPARPGSGRRLGRGGAGHRGHRERADGRAGAGRPAAPPPVGWLLLAFGLSGVAAGVATGYSGFGLLARPGSLPGAAWVATYEQHAGIPTGACLGLILLLTRLGRRRRRAGAGGCGSRRPRRWWPWPAGCPSRSSSPSTGSVAFLVTAPVR